MCTVPTKFHKIKQPFAKYCNLTNAFSIGTIVHEIKLTVQCVLILQSGECLNFKTINILTVKKHLNNVTVN